MLNLKAETDAVFRWVCDAYGIEPDDLTGLSREHPIGEARMVAYYLARRRGMSYPRIGRLFKRDHTSVMSGVKRAAKLLTTDANIAALVVKFCAERDAFDGDALLAIPGKPPDKPVEKVVETVGKAGGVSEIPPDPPSASGVSNSGSESDPPLSSGSKPVSKRARSAPKAPKVPCPPDFDEAIKPRVFEWARGKHYPDWWTNDRIEQMRIDCGSKSIMFADWYLGAIGWLNREDKQYGNGPDALTARRQGRNGVPPGFEQHNEHKQAQGARIAQRVWGQMGGKP